LRQRLGRSGRRPGEPAILRGYVVEDAIDKQSSLATRLRLDTVQIAATISLLLENWFEPPVVHGVHFSTLIQQLQSSIAQYGGLNAAHAYRLSARLARRSMAYRKKPLANCCATWASKRF
jgi:ATP-dependent helicase Lhr and Lhr-like helicase